MQKENNIGLDTTVILRLLTGEPQNQFAKSKQFIATQLNTHKKLFVSDLVIAEAYFALQYHYEVPKKEALVQLSNIFSSGIIHPAPGSVCSKVLRDAPQHNAGFVDQVIYEQYCLFADQVVSFDKAMSELEKVFSL